jgi:hypothetical protein
MKSYFLLILLGLFLSACFHQPEIPQPAFRTSQEGLIQSLQETHGFDTIIFQPAINVRSNNQTGSLTIILRAGANLPQEKLQLEALAEKLKHQIASSLVNGEDFGQFHIVFQNMKKEVWIHTGHSESFSFDF